MMRQYELVERVLRYDPTADEALLNRAYVYAMKAHGNQKRKSGAPYFSHPLEVAAILTDLKLDDATIATALLHDVIEDTETTRSEIDQLFGPEIGALVDGLTKIKKLDLVSKKAEQAENFRKLLIAISSDIRVLLVKLADRLHNMRTLEHMRPESRQRISEETLEIYAPLAGRMGMQYLREELEALAFRWLNPEAYAAVIGRLNALSERNSGLIGEIAKALDDKLTEAGIKAQIKGRQKTPYSIWRKMENKQISLEQLSDIFGFRIIVEGIDDCYRALGIVHTSWRTVPGRFKDYVSTPKQNDYQSIHTTIVGPRHQRVELQIRTRAMHEVAEYGVAAHALYKDQIKLPGEAALSVPARRVNGNGSALKSSNPYMWLRRLVDTLLEGDNPEEFLEHTKLELFQDQVFCFTPKGRLIALPKGANPIDFAYTVHTDVGNSCIGAKVNGRHQPLTTALRNGDEVEIICSKMQTPPAAWEQLAVTGKARSAIRRAAREATRKQFSELGRRLLEHEFHRIGESYSDDQLKKGLPRLTQKTVEDALAAVARNELPPGDVTRAVFPDASVPVQKPPSFLPRNRLERPGNDEGWFNLKKAIGFKFRMPGRSGADAELLDVASAENGAARGVPIRGLKSDLPVAFGEVGVVPGDRIVGILTPGKGMLIYPIHSPKLQDFEQSPMRWIDVAWDISEERPERFQARLLVTARNEPGSLAQIAQVIGGQEGNIDNLRMVTRAADFTDMLIEVEVWDLKHLGAIMAGLTAKPVVAKVERVFGDYIKP